MILPGIDIQRRAFRLPLPKVLQTADKTRRKLETGRRFDINYICVWGASQFALRRKAAMAKIVQAVNACGPKLNLHPTVGLERVSEWSAMRTGIKSIYGDPSTGSGQAIAV